MKLLQTAKKGISDNLLNFLIPVGSAILGLLLSALLDNWSKPWFDTLTKVVLTGAVLLGVTIVAGMVSAGVLVRRIDAQRARGEQHLEDIAHRLGVTVDFHSVYSKAEGADMFRRDQSIIAKAQREILVLQYRPRPPGSLWVKEGLSSYEARREWFRTLYEKAWEHRTEGSFFTRRIIQIPEGPDQELKDVLESDPVYAEHLQSMLALQSEFKDSTYVKTSRIVIETTIVLVDDRHVLLELRSEEPETKLLGTFHFDDTTGALVQQLKRLWQRMDAQAILVTKVS